MMFQESILAIDTAINDETDALEVIAPTSLTTRTGYGKPKITHIASWVSSDDVEKTYVLPSSFAEGHGIPCPLISHYGAVNGFRFKDAMLPAPIEVPENTLLTPYAVSETAADTVVLMEIILEYPSGGKFQPIASGPSMTRRAWEHGAALVSNVEAASTDIDDLAAGVMYQPCGLGHAGVNGATAGIVGPAFLRFTNPEMEGALLYIPLVNNGAYQVGNGPGQLDFRECGIKMPYFAGGTLFRTACIGYTAEQPQAELNFIVNKSLFPA